MTNIFTKHPQSFDESFLAHGFKAISYSFMMMSAAVRCCIHAFFPFLFQSTASSIAYKIYQDVKKRRKQI